MWTLQLDSAARKSLRFGVWCLPADVSRLVVLRAQTGRQAQCADRREDQRIVLFNHGAEQIFGWNREEVIVVGAASREQVWRAHRPKHGGAGLGLPIARRIVEAHAGHIWAESEEGAGATFFFTLPKAVAQTAARCPPGKTSG